MSMTGLGPLFITALGVLVYVGLPLEYCRWKWQKMEQDYLLILCCCFVGCVIVMGGLIYADLIPRNFGLQTFLAITAGIGSFFVVFALWEVFFNTKKD